ncbi:hypothetical protein ACOTTU_20165 [Roseobacter sp. EG26]|uniref:hypothetical protein n=1 Tax=Roseobacter sp. EG26 TaxID=3412477 RepID=UPI00261AB222|nr:hypothetical protein [uncultured Roseobacter sp.]
MSETLYTSEAVVLFGREVEDLAVVSVTSGDNVLSKKEEQFARIYGFTYDGVYYEIPTPVLYLVKGDSEKAADVAVPGPNEKNVKFFKELRAWTVKRTDETVRLALDQGKFETLLLEMMSEGASGVSGARVSGARVSGARVSGARVSGARISGARGDASD